MPKNSHPGHVILTGGSGGIGRAIVERLVGVRGARCSVLDLESDPSMMSESVRAFRCDVTDQSEVHQAVANACEWGGSPTGLVALAGIVSNDETLRIEAARWRHIISVHLDGTLFACQAVADQMAKASGGSLVTFCSVAMDFGVPGRAAYGAAKAGIRSLTKTLACEWATYGIRVNAVAPGDVRTGMYDELVGHGVINEELVKSAHALGRIAEPSEVATAVDFLLSDDSSFITGTTLYVDGGFTAKKL